MRTTRVCSKCKHYWARPYAFEEGGKETMAHRCYKDNPRTHWWELRDFMMHDPPEGCPYELEQLVSVQ